MFFAFDSAAAACVQGVRTLANEWQLCWVGYQLIPCVFA